MALPLMGKIALTGTVRADFDCQRQASEETQNLASLQQTGSASRRPAANPALTVSPARPMMTRPTKGGVSNGGRRTTQDDAEGISNGQGQDHGGGGGQRGGDDGTHRRGTPAGRDRPAGHRAGPAAGQGAR